MTNKILIISSFAFLLLGSSCNLFCRGKKVPLGLIYANKNDSLKVILNNEVMVDKVIKEEYDGHFEARKDRLAIWCISEDSVLVKVIFNSRDTSFYLFPKLIRGWYVGCNLQRYIDVYYDYEKGGLGDYAPFR